jgi:natural product biosynthesis luciferase-like monooxygenase protein/amino acid adenylation domain-containing protein
LNAASPLFDRIEGQVAFPLTSSQREVWFDQAMHGRSPLYNIGGYMCIEGQLDHRRFSQAFNLLLRKHDSLCTVLVPASTQDDANLPQQIFVENVHLEVPLHDFSSYSDPHAFAVEWMQARLETPFEMYGELFFRCDLVKVSDNLHYWSMHFHHLITDGWGIALVGRSMASIYSALEAEQEPDLQAPQYKSYIAEDLAYQGSESYFRQRNYWLSKFANVPDPVLVPIAGTCDATTQRSSDCRILSLSRSVYNRLATFAENKGSTTFQVILALVYVYFARIAQREDIVIGIPVLNRSNAAHKGTSGQFVGISPVRIALPEELKFEEVLTALAAILRKDYRYQRFPISEINRAIGLHQVDRPQLFDISVSYERHDHVVSFGSAKARSIAMLNGHQQTPLTLFFREFHQEEDVRIDFVYNTRYLNEDSILAMQRRFHSLLEAVMESAGTRVMALPLLTNDESAFLDRWNATEATYRLPSRIHEMFEEQAIVCADTFAVIDDEREVSYRELNEHANRLVRRLSALGIQPNSRVALCMPRSVRMVIALLAILKTGATYVPIDPAYPAERIAYLIEDSAPSAVLLQAQIPETARLAIQTALLHKNRNVPLIDLELDAVHWEHEPASNLAVPDLPPPDESVAYVIYTSGSTGKPKGVANTVAGLRNRLSWFHQSISKGAPITAFKTSVGFVDSVTEILETLVAGGTLVTFDHATVLDPIAFARRIKRYGISNIVVVPSLLKHFVALDPGYFETVKTLVCSGERLNAELVQAFQQAHPGIHLFNFYGSSEANGDSTAFEYEVGSVEKYGDRSVIGRPIANTRIYILDKRGRRMPIGIPGELYISGIGLAQGYLNRPDWTTERFVEDPFSDKLGARMYRTGDMARFLPDGNIEFLGRNDFQVKIRGFRVELGEIEAAIARHPQVKACAVAAHDMGGDRRQLAAYIVPQDVQGPDGAHPRATPIGFSLFYFGADTFDPNEKYRLYLQSAKYADENGFEAVWTPERHFHEVGGLYPNPSVLSAALATVTKRVKLRSGSVVLPLQNPIRVAEEWAVVDNLSGGRIGVSVASGWVPRDFVLAPRNYVSRKDIMASGIDVLKSLWRGDQVLLRDGTGKESAIRVFPKPVQQDLPLWITSSGNPETFVQAGKLGANILTHLLGQTIDEVAANIRLYRQARAEHGHDPEAGKVTLMAHTFVGEDFDVTLSRAREPFIRYMRSHLGLLEAFAKGLDIPTEVLEAKNVDTIVSFAFERYSRTASLIGTPHTCLEVVARLSAIGVNEIACLIDWIDTESALQGLPQLDHLRQLAGKALPSPAGLRKHLKASLPDYMVPANFTFLNRLPLTSNGKLDRKALPKPAHTAADRQYIAPATRTEKLLAKIYSRILDIDTIGTQDRFFDLGGDSLLAVKLSNGIMESFGISIAIRELFEHTTLQELAGHLDTLEPAAAFRSDHIPSLASLSGEFRSKTSDAMVVRI